MLISIVLLILNAIFLLVNGTPWFGFWNLLWMVPLEIILYILIFIGYIKYLSRLLAKGW